MDGMVQWGTFLRIRLQFPERFTPSRCLISQGCALPASPAGKLLYRAFGCRVYRNAPERLQKNLPRRGRGTARRRWMRGGTAFNIVGTTGAEVKHIERPPWLSLWESQGAGWRQIAAATVGCTIFRVVPFTPTGYTSHVAGGRLPPLRQCTTFFAFYGRKTVIDTL